MVGLKRERSTTRSTRIDATAAAALATVTTRASKGETRVEAGAEDRHAALAREAVELLEATDLLSQHGAAMLDLAEVLRSCGHLEAADEATRAGRALHERKGNLVAGGT
jgi:hypothetical protein